MPLGPRIALITACLLWAVSFVATKEALASVPPLTVVTIRLAISALCFACWMGLAGKLRALPTWPVIAKLFGLSLLGTGLHYGMQTYGLQFTSASNGSLYGVMAPLTIALLGWLVLRERLGVRKLLGIGLAVAGVLTVMGLDALVAFKLNDGMFGDLLVIASIAMWGLFTVFGKKLTDELGALSVTAWVTVIGATATLPVGWLESRAAGFSWRDISLRAWAAIGFLGVGCSFLATLLYFVALQKTESQKVSVYLYTTPLMTPVVAYFYLGEALGLSFLVGLVLVLLGVRLTESANVRSVRQA